MGIIDLKCQYEEEIEDEDAMIADGFGVRWEKGEFFAKRRVMLMAIHGRNHRNEKACAGLEQCDEMCYKGPVLKDQQWSVYIDRAPGSASYSEDCHRACVAGCGFKFDISSAEVDKIQSSRSSKPPAEEEPADKNKST
ncbi:General transcription factor IIH subunit [Capsicum annuum]|nr:General transcription factor IIH subunit [Capsicum annuum]KAF3653523.1 General transcription factor IIH subunit [Capsicum annuum]